MEGLVKLGLAALIVVMAATLSGAAPEVLTCCGDCDERICVKLDRPDQIPDLVAASTHLFVGKVIAAEMVSCCERQVLVTFRVLEAWKGASDQPIVVLAGAHCSRAFPFMVGEHYLLAATGLGTKVDPAIPYICEFPPLKGNDAILRVQALREWQRSAGAQEPSR